MLRVGWLITMYAAGWLFFWLREGFNMSQLLVTINTAIQLFAVARLPPLTRTSPALLWTTHLVAKTFAGIGILDFIDNGGVALVCLNSAILHGPLPVTSNTILMLVVSS